MKTSRTGVTEERKRKKTNSIKRQRTRAPTKRDKRPGEAGRGYASDAKRIGTRTKRGSWGLETYNTIVEVPVRLNLK